MQGKTSSWFHGEFGTDELKERKGLGCVEKCLLYGQQEAAPCVGGERRQHAGSGRRLQRKSALREESEEHKEYHSVWDEMRTEM